jgi:hypothetical protein
MNSIAMKGCWVRSPIGKIDEEGRRLILYMARKVAGRVRPG